MSSRFHDVHSALRRFFSRSKSADPYMSLGSISTATGMPTKDVEAVLLRHEDDMRDDGFVYNAEAGTVRRVS